MPVATQDEQTLEAVSPRTTVELHVRRLPRDVWLRARQNALRSSLPFREFIIRILAGSEPLPPTKLSIEPTVPDDNPA